MGLAIAPATFLKRLEPAGRRWLAAIFIGLLIVLFVVLGGVTNAVFAPRSS